MARKQVKVFCSISSPLFSGSSDPFAAVSQLEKLHQDKINKWTAAQPKDMEIDEVAQSQSVDAEGRALLSTTLTYRKES